MPELRIVAISLLKLVGHITFWYVQVEGLVLTWPEERTMRSPLVLVERSVIVTVTARSSVQGSA